MVYRSYLCGVVVIRYILLILLISGCTGKLAGQDTTSHKLALSLSYHYGFLIAHRPMVVPLQKDKLNAVQGDIILRTDGSKEWHRAYGFPEIGVSLSYWDIGNKEQLGYGLSAMPYIAFPLSKGDRHNFDLKFGWGIGYIEKKFDADDNHKNIAIGSHLNCALTLQPRYQIKLTDRLKFGAGISITHFSNGSVSTPNLGINLASVTGGITYNTGKIQKLKFEKKPPFTKSTRITIFGAGSVKQVYPAEGKTYYACTLSGNITRQKTRKSGIGAGADIFYDNSIYKKLDERDLTLNNSFEAFRVGLHGSYELVISDLSLMLSMGGYLYSKLQNDGSIYHRIAIRYQITEKIFACMNLKSHWGKADYIEWGIGYRLDFKKKDE